MRKSSLLIARLAISIVTFSLLVVYPTHLNAQDDSTDETFARYARYGADIWAANPSATISGEDKACVSCHTSLPYALVEPLLPEPYAAYTDLIENINERVLTWQDNTPWYSEAKAEQTAELAGLPPDALKEILNAGESRGVESIFNAFILAMHDAYDHLPAQPTTRLAFSNMWSEQLQTGASAGSWKWITANLIPWEVDDSDLWGASLACVAASQYPELVPVNNLELLYTRLRQGVASSKTSLHVRTAILWCNAESDGRLIGSDISEAIVLELLDLQHSNGGWAIRELGPWIGWEESSADCCAQREVRPDVYATGFVTFVLSRIQQLAASNIGVKLEPSIAWIDQKLADPYPAEPRNNRHNSSEEQFPQFRNNVYTNAGHMWAFLAKTVNEDGRAPWDSE